VRIAGPGPGARMDRFPPPSHGRWCPDARDDPTTGLVAWPGFFRRVPALLHQAPVGGTPVGRAIGDVDGMKDHVESLRGTDAGAFGHLAGNALVDRALFEATHARRAGEDVPLGVVLGVLPRRGAP
jgi:hypothetical protein